MSDSNGVSRMSTKKLDDILNRIVSFDLIGNLSTVMGTPFKNVLVSNVLDADMARYAGFDALALHQNIRRLAPNNAIPAQHNKYTYLLCVSPDKTKHLVGIPWIDWDSITISTTQKVVVEVLDADIHTLQLVRLQLAAANLKIGKLELVDV